MTVQGEGSYLPTYVAADPVSAWKSVPGFVRVAVWIWSLAIVLSVLFGILTGLALALGMAAGS